MNTDDRYKIKLWGYLKKLFKSKGDSILLIGKMLLFTLMSNAFMLSAYAQTPRKDSGVNGQVKYELTGVVVSSIDGTPLQGVSVRFEADNLQIKTSKDGRFQLTISNKSGKIRFSSIGFKSQELNYTAGVSMTVKLIPEDNKLEEVNVVSISEDTERTCNREFCSSRYELLQYASRIYCFI